MRNLRLALAPTLIFLLLAAAISPAAARPQKPTVSWIDVYEPEKINDALKQVKSAIAQAKDVRTKTNLPAQLETVAEQIRLATVDAWETTSLEAGVAHARTFRELNNQIYTVFADLMVFYSNVRIQPLVIATGTLSQVVFEFQEAATERVNKRRAELSPRARKALRLEHRMFKQRKKALARQAKHLDRVEGKLMRLGKKVRAQPYGSRARKKLEKQLKHLEKKVDLDNSHRLRVFAISSRLGRTLARLPGAGKVFAKAFRPKSTFSQKRPSRPAGRARRAR